MGGWTQVAAHGTGCSLSTVDEMIEKMTIALPVGGLMPLSRSNNPHIFNLAKVGLGSVGVVTELTLKCIPQLSLEENLSTISSSELINTSNHYERLSTYRHVRYMWIPHTDKVVVVVSNPTNKSPTSCAYSSSEATAPLAALLRSVYPDKYPSYESTKIFSFSELRDQLVAHDPLNVEYIKRVNEAEAQFWQNSAGTRVDDSTNILGFDCGGEQWVFEVCFNIGKLSQKSGKDVKFVQKLLSIIENEKISAPSPIEQRWTARSTAPLSPAHSQDPEDIFSWVGIIMYLPSHEDPRRIEVTQAFRKYCEVIQPLLDEYDAHAHWAKIELPDKSDRDYGKKVEGMRVRLSRRYPVHEFNELRKATDPKGILSNELIDELFRMK